MFPPLRCSWKVHPMQNAFLGAAVPPLLPPSLSLWALWRQPGGDGVPSLPAGFEAGNAALGHGRLSALRWASLFFSVPQWTPLSRLPHAASAAVIRGEMLMPFRFTGHCFPVLSYLGALFLRWWCTPHRFEKNSFLSLVCVFGEQDPLCVFSRREWGTQAPPRCSSRGVLEGWRGSEEDHCWLLGVDFRWWARKLTPVLLCTRRFWPLNLFSSGMGLAPWRKMTAREGSNLGDEHSQELWGAALRAALWWFMGVGGCRRGMWVLSAWWIKCPFTLLLTYKLSVPRRQWGKGFLGQWCGTCPRIWARLCPNLSSGHSGSQDWNWSKSPKSQLSRCRNSHPHC